MRKLVAAIAGCVLTLGAGGLGAQTAAPPSGDAIAKAFGTREYIQQISLSPGGGKVAMIVPAKGNGTALMIGDLANGGDPKPILVSSGNPDHLTDCHWSTDTRLICNVYLTGSDGVAVIGYNRIIALNVDGSGLKMLSTRTTSQALNYMQNGGDLIDWGAGGNGSALMTRTYVPEVTTGTSIANTRAGMGVDLVDTNTLTRKVVEQPRDGAVEYISDGQGLVRIMGIRSKDSSGYDANKITYMYRTPGSRAWQPLSTLTVTAGRVSGFNPYAVDPLKNLVYGLDNVSGHTGLYSISLDGSLTRKAVIERSDVDLNGLVQVGRQNRVVGATYITDRREAEFFDPALRSLRTSLGKALPGRLVTFVDASADETKLLLFAGSDVDSGKYYLFNKATHELGEVMPARPLLADIALATVQSITYKAGDGTSIPAYLTVPAGSSGKNLPAIVMPHGGPGARDEWGFDWLAQYFAARGYAVIQPNFRGSTGYGDAWYQKNGFQSWRTAIGDVNDAGHWLVKSGIADPKKLAIVGWSYGGYAALQTSVLDPDLFKAIVAVAPVTDLETLRNEAKDYASFPQVDAFIGHGPWVTEGSPARNAAKIKAPVLLFHGDRDQNVGIGESRMMVGKLKGAGGKVELVEFKGLDHQLDDSTARTTLLARADAFLRASMGM